MLGHKNVLTTASPDIKIVLLLPLVIGCDKSNLENRLFCSMYGRMRTKCDA